MKLYLLFLITIPASLVAQHTIVYSASDVRALSAGQSGVAQWHDGSGLMNPAQLPFAEKGSFEVFGKNHYALVDLFAGGLSLQMKSGKTSATSLHLVREGSSDYSETLVNLSYGHLITMNSSVGIGFNGFIIQQTERRTTCLISGNIGIRSALGKNLLLACAVHNPFALWSNSPFKLPFHFAAGLNFKIYPELELQAEVQKEGYSPAFIGFGFNYRPLVPLELGMGCETSGPNILVGFRYELNSHYKMACTANFHFLIGLSSSISFRYYFNQSL